jgi:hypothetical protein
LLTSRAMMSYSVEDAYFDVRSMTFMWADEWSE